MQQIGIDLAADNDTVIVGDGVYYENINFNGKAITVVSENGPANTTINGSGSGNAVTFNSGEGSGSVIEGFTITNGTYGIYNDKSSPVIRGNEIRDNGNHGIYNYAHNPGTSSPQVTDNLIQDNVGYGIYNYANHRATASPEIKGNTIIGNNNGIYNDARSTNSISSPIIENNLIQDNGYYGIYNYARSTLNGRVSPQIRYNTITGHNVGIYNKRNNGTLQPVINYNNIYSNTTYGVQNTYTGIDINAVYNWWGDASGPYHLTNPSGTGDAVSDNVIYRPWLLTAFTDDSPMNANIDPTAITSINIYEDRDYTIDANSLGILSPFYIEIQGIDGDSGNVNFTTARITSTSDATGIEVILIETGANTGIYRGAAKITTSSNDINDYIGAAVSDIITVTPDEDTSYTATITVSDTTTWTANNPDPMSDGHEFYHYSETVTIPAGSILIIEAGAIIRFGNSSRLHIEGTLTINGTASEPVLFTSNSPVPSAGDWVGIKIYNDGSVIDYAIIEYAETGIAFYNNTSTITNSIIRYSSDDGIYNEASASTITDNAIHNNGRYGIYNDNSSPVIRGNEIRDNGNHGIYNYAYYYETSSPQVTDNRIQDNGGYGIYNYAYNRATASPEIRGNTIIGNNNGIYNDARFTNSVSSPVIENNLIQDNGSYGIYNYARGSLNVSPQIRYNTITGHDAGIYNKRDQGTLQPLINYNNIYNNTTYGVQNTSSQDIDAKYNFWGDASGPYDPSNGSTCISLYNPSGQGEPVTDCVDYDPWLGKTYGTLEAKIVSISPNSAAFKEIVTFTGEGENAVEITAYQWRSDIDGILSTVSEPVFMSSNLSVGIHTIYLRVQDEGGAWSDEVSEQLEIKEPSGDKADLAIEWGDITFYDVNGNEISNAASLDDVIIKVRVHNIGEKTSNNVSIEFYDQFSGGGGTLGSAAAAPISPDSIGEAEFTWSGRKQEGYHIIHVKIVKNDTEEYEGNNNATKSLIIGDVYNGDMWVEITMGLTNTNKVPCEGEPPVYEYPKVSPGDSISVFGNAQYVWEDGKTYPVLGAKVKVEVSGIIGEWNTYTYTNGNYSKTLSKNRIDESLMPVLPVGDYWVRVTVTDSSVSSTTQKILRVREEEEEQVCEPEECDNDTTGNLQVNGLWLKNQVAGENETIMANILNKGGVSVSNEFFVSFTAFSPDGAEVFNDVFLIEEEIIEPDGSVIISSQEEWIPQVEGDYTIKVYVQRLGECNENDNFGSQKVYIFPARPELAVGNILNFPGDIYASVQNKGGKIPSPSTVHFKADNEEFCSTELAPVPPKNGTLRVSCSSAVLSPGYPEICVSVDRVPYETDPEDNSVCKRLVISSPDLHPRYMGVSPPNIDEPASISATVRNSGANYSTQGSIARFYVDGTEVGITEIPVIGFRKDIKDAQRYEKSVSVTQTFTNAGKYNICVEVEDANDPNLTNNRSCRYIDIYPSTVLLPDLKISSDDITFSNDSPEPGEEVGISVSVHNVGRGTATKFNIAFYEDGKRPVGAIQTIEVNGGLQPGDVYIAIPKDEYGNEVKWISQDSDDHIIYIIVAPIPPEIDPNETNNEATRVIQNISVGEWSCIFSDDFEGQTEMSPPRWNDKDGIDAVYEENGNVIVKWNSAWDSTGPVTYNIYYSASSPALDGTKLANVPASGGGNVYDFQYTVTGLDTGLVYYFTVRAQDSASPPNEDINTKELGLYVGGSTN